MKKRYVIDWAIMDVPVIRECHESATDGKSFKKTKKELLKRIKDKRKHWKRLYKNVKKQKSTEVISHV